MTTSQLQATISANELLLHVRTPLFTNSPKLLVELEAQIEQQKQIIRYFTISDTDQLQLADNQGTLEATYENGQLMMTARKAGEFTLTDITKNTLGAEGNVSLEIKDALSKRKLILLTIVSIGPAPRTTATRIRLADETLISPLDFV